MPVRDSLVSIPPKHWHRGGDQLHFSHKTHQITSGSQCPASNDLSYGKGGDDWADNSSSMPGTVKQRGLTTARMGRTGGSFGSVVTKVRHFNVSKTDRCAAGLLRGDVRNNFLEGISKHGPPEEGGGG